MTPRPQPVDPPTFQSAKSEGTGTRISWTNDVSNDFDLTLVARYLGSADGVARGPVPAVGASFGSGEVLHASPETTALDPVAPQACRKVNYQLFTHGRSGAWSAPVIAIARGTPLPLDPPAAFTAERVGAMVQLNWTPTSSRTQVRREGTLIYEGAASSTSDLLAPAAAATWRAFACNACDECSELSAVATLEAPDAGPPLDYDAGHELKPLSLTAQLSPDAGAVSLAWSLPDAGVTHVRLLRRRDLPVYGPADPAAAVVFDGLAAGVDEPVTQVVPDPLTNHYAAFGCDGTQCEQAGAVASLHVPLPVALRAGGYNVWFRHATAMTCFDHSELRGCSQGDAGWSCPNPDWWKSCATDCSTATARQLTGPQSDVELAAIHSAFVGGRFPVGRVRSSEFCRGVMTAEGFGFGPVETSEVLTFFVYDEGKRCVNSYALLDEAPDAGTNTVLVGHAGFSCPVLDGLAPAEAAVFKPDPRGVPLLIRRIKYDEW